MPGGSAWNSLNGNFPSYFYNALAIRDSFVFAAGDYTSFYISDDFGNSWTQGGSTGYTIVSLALDNVRIYAGTLSGVFYSDDNGLTWNQINTGLTNLNVWSLAVKGIYIFAGTDSGVFVSNNGGGSWVASNSGLTNLSVNCLAFNNNRLFAGTDSGSFFSDDNGATWNFTGQTGITSAITVKDSIIISGFFGGIYISTDNGITWNLFNQGLENYFILSLSISDSLVFAGSGYRGVWRRSIADIMNTITEKEPIQYPLTVFPNPYTALSTMTFTLAHPAELRAIVYEGNGRLVWSEELGQFTAGRKEIKLNIPEQHFASGLYCLQIAGTGVSYSCLIVVSGR